MGASIRRITFLLLAGSLGLTTAVSSALAQPALSPTDRTSFCVGGGLKSTEGVIQLINFVFRNGPAPQPVLAVGDVNCREGVSASDIIYLINYVLRSGPPPCPYCGFLDTDTSLHRPHLLVHQGHGRFCPVHRRMGSSCPGAAMVPRGPAESPALLVVNTRRERRAGTRPTTTGPA